MMYPIVIYKNLSSAYNTIVVPDLFSRNHVGLFSSPIITIQLDPDSCSDDCAKCLNRSDTCKGKCTAHKKYYECQEKCVISTGKDARSCIDDVSCRKKCNSKCKQLWPGIMLFITYDGTYNYPPPQ